MGNLLIVNAPIVFSGVWSVCKGFLDEKTRKKVRIVGYGFKAVLLEYIDDQDIPSFLGGKCECKEYGGCMKSNLGPWNDYEIAGPKTVRKREKFHPDVNGRCIFYGPDGTPILKVREPNKPIAEMVGNLEDAYEESKESGALLKDDDDENFEDADDGSKPSAESMQIIQTIEKSVASQKGQDSGQ
jgi:hypothetical protein